MASYTYAPSTFFTVSFGTDITGMSGEFTSVSGINMEFEYETYNEGGSMYPRYFLKGLVPQTLVLEQGTVTNSDSFASWLSDINSGKTKSLDGTITLKDHTGTEQRSWSVQGASVLRYIGPKLDSLRSELAVTRIELQHNGCM